MCCLSLRSALSIAAVLFVGTATHAETVDSLSFDQKLRLANTGDEEAQIAVARAYENGIEVRISQVKAADWYRKAADQGNPGAMFRLARILSKGAPGVDKNLEAAFKLYDGLPAEARSRLRTGSATLMSTVSVSSRATPMQSSGTPRQPIMALRPHRAISG